MKINLSDIKKSFLNELIEFDKTFKSIMSSDVKLIDMIVKNVVKNNGKKLRPLLVIMSAKFVGEPAPTTYIVASVIELLHSASLIHDDVVDDAHIRRGFPSVNAVWENKTAVLIGDYMLSQCLISAVKTNKLDIMQILADTSKRLIKGELMQIEKSRNMKISEEEYFEIISNKTGALMSAATELGVMTVSDNLQDRENLRRYGEFLGTAFQIKDDLLDYYGTQSIIGKPVGNDFKDNKITLPLIYAFQHARQKEINEIKKLLKKGINNKGIEFIINFAEEYGGIEYAANKQDEYAQKAKDCLNDYPSSDVKSALIQFVDYSIQRSK